ncbi:MAG TPA: maleylpyruvate isomerase N-terminal domain-containing protein [Terriglobales bacterium]|nr:maleylpyruvate isomerase N-terminal domain-containing protein [Terriglobales bacterium]
MQRQPPPILTAHLFSPLEAKLLELLRSLSPEEWATQTVSPRWKVKDVAAHLLDTALRKLSLVRDGWGATTPDIRSAADLAAFVNEMNRKGVSFFGRLSPAVLVSLMEVASRESSRYHESLDPMGPARFAVSWAGESESLNWFDTAREFTERWHHQQQIRLAVGRPGIMVRQYYHPVLDCFMRALPFAYRAIPARTGSLAQFNVSGDCGGSWFLYRKEAGWRLLRSPEGDTISETTIPQEIAWRIFTNGIDRESATAQVQIRGDRVVGGHVLDMIAIVA